MEEKRLPWNFLAAWACNPRPIRRPQITTIRNTYIDALRMIGAIDSDDKQGRFEKWLQQII
eukprot:1381023-Ditylum_brightwellii.AAC.1